MSKATTAAPERGEEPVELLIPRVGPDDRPVLIGVNGEFIRVQPGERVRVRRKFAEAWENAQSQENAAWEARVQAQNASRRALAEL